MNLHNCRCRTSQIIHVTKGRMRSLCGVRVAEMLREKPGTPVEIDCERCRRIAINAQEKEITESPALIPAP